ncbi:MAG: peptidase M61, partial [Bacteroidota bacterium]
MRILCIGLFSVILISSWAQDEIKVYIDLRNVSDDKVAVEFRISGITETEIEYHMPKIVPGTYSISDFGRFVSGFSAVDKLGKPLPVERLSTNRWKISNSKSLSKISYWIDDSFDKFPGYGKNKLFEPGGVSIDDENQLFIMNTFGFIGYLQGCKFSPIELTIDHPASIYGATSLERVSSTSSRDVFTALNYNFLADAPIMYCEPDTITKKIAGAEILISLFSPNKVLSSEQVMDNIYDLMEAQALYLGGELPVDRYTYLIYLFDKPTLSGAYGALEHSYSSLYTLPEQNAANIGQIVRDVAAHEFLHIVTPLNIHSEEIHNFDYINPQLSEHLWLYEGVTEYSAQLVQVK